MHLTNYIHSEQKEKKKRKIKSHKRDERTKIRTHNKLYKTYKMQECVYTYLCALTHNIPERKKNQQRDETYKSRKIKCRTTVVKMIIVLFL